MSQAFFNDLLNENRRLREQVSDLQRDLSTATKELAVEKEVNKMMNERIEEEKALIAKDLKKLADVEKSYKHLQREHRRALERLRTLKESGTICGSDLQVTRAASTIRRYKSMYEAEVHTRKGLEKQLAKATKTVDKLQSDVRGKRKSSEFVVARDHDDPFVSTKVTFLPSPDRPDPMSPAAPLVPPLNAHSMKRGPSGRRMGSGAGSPYR